MLGFRASLQSAMKSAKARWKAALLTRASLMRCCRPRAICGTSPAKRSTASSKLLKSGVS